MKKAERGVVRMASAAVSAVIVAAGLFMQVQATVIFGSIAIENWPERLRCRCEVPIAGATVYLKIPDTRDIIGGEGYIVSDSTVSDDSGKFTFSNSGTNFRITAEASGYRRQSIDFKATSDSNYVPVMRLVSEKSFAGFSGGVYRENVSHPVPGCTVTVSMFYNDRGAVAPLTFRTVTSATGLYYITGVPVTANYYPVSIVVKGPLTLAVDTFALVNTQRHVDLYAAAAHRISVTGTVARGASELCAKCGLSVPVSGARVYVTVPRETQTNELGLPMPIVGGDGYQTRDSVVTNADGSWSISALPYAVFRIVAKAPGYHPSVLSFSNVAGDTTVSIKMVSAFETVVQKQSDPVTSPGDAIVVNAAGKASLVLSTGRVVKIETYGLDGRLLAPARLIALKSGVHQLAIHSLGAHSSPTAVIVRVSGSGLVLTKRVVVTGQ